MNRSSVQSLSARRPTLLAIGVAVLVFAAIAPTLAWQEFSSGSENLVVETVLEMRRGGPWLVPTLQLQPRTQKPPLTAWITAAAADQKTVDALNTPDRAARDAAFRDLSWQVRWPSLLCSCLTLLLVFALGREIAGSSVGLAAAMMYGSCGLFFKFGRYATTDVQLSLWTTLANLLLARALFHRRWWTSCLMAGVALGLAFMSKGPVTLVQSVLPVAAFAAWQAWSRRGLTCVDGEEETRVRTTRRGDASDPDPAPTPGAPHPGPAAQIARRNHWVLPSLAGLCVMLAIGLPWFALVLLRVRGVGGLWVGEVTRVGVTDDVPDPWYSYIVLLPLMLPWAIFFVVGLIASTRDLLARTGSRRVLAMILTVLPVLVMTVSPDKKDRYLLPMAGPAAILAAIGLREVLNGLRERRTASGILLALHWTIAGLAILLPVAAALPKSPLKTADGYPWFTLAQAIPMTLGLAAIILAGILLQKRRPMAVAASTFLASLLLQTALYHGYVRHDEGLSEMKRMADAIWAMAPDAEVYYRHHRRAPNDLAIYLDRPVPQLKKKADLPPPSDKPQVMVVIQHRKEPPPEPPAGWSFLTKVDRAGDWMHAFVKRNGR